MTIPLMRATFSGTARGALVDFVRTADQFSCGPKVEAWEQAFAAWQGRRYAVAYNSGSSANLALVQSLLNLRWLKARDRVGFSAVTWATNVMPLMQLGLKPWPVDVTHETLNTAIAVTEGLSSVRTYFFTHVLGLCDHTLDIIVEDEGHLEDCCEAMGSVFRGRKLGNFGLASTFSTFVGHHLSTIEGGLVCTDDDSLYHMLLMVRAHGWNRHLPEATKQALRDEHGRAVFEDRYTFYTLGYNLRPTELTGVLGLAQLGELDAACDQRHANYHRLRAAVAGNPCLSVPTATHLDRVSSFAFPIVARTPQIRAALVDRCQHAGIEVRPLIAGNITQQPFYQQSGAMRGSTPVASQIDQCGCYVPNRPDLTDAELDRIAEVLAA